MHPGDLMGLEKAFPLSGKPCGSLDFFLKLVSDPREGGMLGQCRGPVRSTESNMPQTHRRIFWAFGRSAGGRGWGEKEADES